MLNKYLAENYNKLKDVSYNITNGKGEDLLSFVIVELYKCDQEKLTEIIERDQMTFYVVRIMLNQFHSKTSRFYYKYHKYYEYHTTTTIESITADNTQYNIKEKEKVAENLAWIEEKLEDVYWFDAEIIRIYYREAFSLNQMAKATKISRATIYKAVKNVKEYLINEK